MKKKELKQKLKTAIKENERLKEELEVFKARHSSPDLYDAKKQGRELMPKAELTAQEKKEGYTDAHVHGFTKYLNSELSVFVQKYNALMQNVDESLKDLSSSEVITKFHNGEIDAGSAFEALAQKD